MTRPEILIHTRHQGDAAIVDVMGEVDLATAPALQSALEQAVDLGCCCVIANLDDTRYIDSTGVRVLLSVHRRAERHHIPFVLASPGPMVQRILTMVGLDTVIPVYPEVDQAVRAAGKLAAVEHR